jgi:hypothetical protein
MKSKLSSGALVGITLFACTASWIGCGGSSATTTDTDAGSATPGGEGGTSETGTTSEAGTDASTEGVDAAITGPFLPVQYKNCPTFTACGGDVKGLWHLTGGCVGEGAFDAAKAQCAGLTESDVVFEARGTIYADATNVTRNTELKFSAKLAIPKACKDNNPVGNKCADADAAIKFAGFDSATCTDAASGGGCDCVVSSITKQASTDAYTTSGNTLTSGAQTFDYCVAGSKIDIKETTAKAIPAVLSLTK